MNKKNRVNRRFCKLWRCTGIYKRKNWRDMCSRENICGRGNIFFAYEGLWFLLLQYVVSMPLALTIVFCYAIQECAKIRKKKLA